MRYLERLLSVMAATPLAVALVACGSHDHPAPADGANAGLDVDAARRTHVVDPSGLAEAHGVGTLVIATSSGAPSYLSSVHAVARDSAGEIVAGADTDANTETDADAIARGELSLLLPAGESIVVSLEAKTTDPEPSVCHAEIPELRVEADASARLQVLSWQCGERTGYVPPSSTSDCYWLVDWMSVARAAANVGEAVPVRVARSSELEDAPSVSWQVEPAAAGKFLKPQADETSFVCAAGGASVSLSATVALGDCVERLQQTIACSAHEAPGE